MVDLVITCFFDPQGLERSLKSLECQVGLNQIVVVDASGDSAEGAALETLLLKWKKKFDVKLIRSDMVPLTAGEARNLGVKVANGKWICFLDAGDEWIKGKQHEFLKYVDDFDVIVCAFFMESSIGTKSVRTRKLNELKLDEHARGQSFCASSIMAKSELLGKFPFPKQRREDFEWMLVVLLDGFKVKYLERPLVVWKYQDKVQHIVKKLPRIFDQFRVYRRHFSISRSLFYEIVYIKRAIDNWIR